jgi:hypothetical protein
VARDWHRPGLAAEAGHTFAIVAFGPELGRA